MKAPRTLLAGQIAGQTLAKGVSRRYAREMAAYLLDEGRTGELDSILRDVQDDWAGAGHVEVTASSAHELTSVVQAEIKRQVKRIYPSARQIVISEVHDPALLGGVRLSLPGRQLDLSLEAKLNQFKQLTAARKD